MLCRGRDEQRWLQQGQDSSCAGAINASLVLGADARGVVAACIWPHAETDTAGGCSSLKQQECQKAKKGHKKGTPALGHVLSTADAVQLPCAYSHETQDVHVAYCMMMLSGM